MTDNKSSLLPYFANWRRPAVWTLGAVHLTTFIRQVWSFPIFRFPFFLLHFGFPFFSFHFLPFPFFRFPIFRFPSILDPFNSFFCILMLLFDFANVASMTFIMWAEHILFVLQVQFKYERTDLSVLYPYCRHLLAPEKKWWKTIAWGKVTVLIAESDDSLSLGYSNITCGLTAQRPISALSPTLDLWICD